MLRSKRAYLSEHGYTLMEVVIVATIIGILVTVGTVQYLEVKRRSKEHYCAQRLVQLATYERMYFREFGEYAGVRELYEEGYIPFEYVHRLGDDEYELSDTPLHYKRPVYIQEYTLEFIIDEEEGGFEIIAEPVLQEPHLWYPRWVPLGGIPELRSMMVDEDGVPKWLETGRNVF